jgi:hypothetical protein
MGMMLGLKRVGRFYKVSPKSFVRENISGAYTFVAGLFVGTYMYKHPFNGPPLWHFIVLLSLLGLRVWAGTNEPSAAAPTNA